MEYIHGLTAGELTELAALPAAFAREEQALAGLAQAVRAALWATPDRGSLACWRLTVGLQSLRHAEMHASVEAAAALAELRRREGEGGGA